MHHRAQQVLKSLVSSGPFQVDTYISNPSLNMQSVYWRAVKYDFEKRSFNLINATTDQPGAPASPGLLHSLSAGSLTVRVHCGFAAGFYHQAAHQESLWLEMMLESVLLVTVTYCPSNTVDHFSLPWTLLAHRPRGEASQTAELYTSCPVRRDHLLAKPCSQQERGSPGSSTGHQLQSEDTSEHVLGLHLGLFVCFFTMHLILTTLRSTQPSKSTPYHLKGTLPHGHFGFNVFGQENCTGLMGS